MEPEGFVGTHYRGRPAEVTCCAMNGEDGYFGEDVAATYDDGFEGHFDPSVIEVTASALAASSTILGDKPSNDHSTDS